MAYDGNSLKSGKKGPRAEVSGVIERPLELNESAVSPDAPADWGSLVADLSTSETPRDPEWRIHDRTHLEFALDYSVRPNEDEVVYEWDAYFFVPESLRLHDFTYEKHDIYEDLQSYIRLAVPFVPLDQIAREPVERLARAITSNDEPLALRELRIFACIFRSSTLAWRKRVLTHLDGTPEGAQSAGDAAIAMRILIQDAVRRMRAVLANVKRDGSSLAVATQWIDEDISRAIETLLGALAIDLRARGASENAVTAVAAGAVDEAVYREANGLDGIGRANADERTIEKLEFQRHVLKRFTSSVLWLTLELQDGKHRIWSEVLAAIAASIAMFFALVFALATPFPNVTSDLTGRSLWAAVLVLVIGYVIRDRVKHSLQKRFDKVVARNFPDRRWVIRDKERKIELGEVEESSGFVEAKEMPKEALDRRRLTRVHAFEEEARPERILWHHKTITVEGEELGTGDERFRALTEIFRLNVRRWLEHTDDPKRKIVFADPALKKVFTATAPRAYNIAVVYRLRRKGDTNAVWHRNRVVVTRKGILRIDPIC